MNPSITTEADIAIIGAGAAGLAAAIFAAETALETDLKIVLLEGARRPGAKILISGGGRCNVTHHRVAPEDFHGKKNVVRNILRAFDEKKTMEWFRSLGVELKREETGKLFPVTDKARTVLDALLGRCSQLGIDLLPGWRVESIRPSESGWTVIGSGGEIQARRLIVSTGGKSLPKSGSDGHGWKMMQAVGHSVTDTWPALVPLLLQDGHGHENLSGISHPVQLTVVSDGKKVESTTGEMLWTHLGISGPAPMDISRTWIRHADLGSSPQLLLSFLPDQDPGSVDRWWIDQGQKSPLRSVLHALSSRVPRRVAEFIGAHAEVDLSCPLAQFPREHRRRLSRELTGHRLAVTGDRGWKLAEVTAGGVPLDEIAYQTMHSRRCDGLYLAGEILDCEGRIGGFNFQWAWATGSIAGSCSARSLLENRPEELRSGD
ncbi:MAG: NAD(P)/FAD-dependent oxidoreductase [Planctomycetota bacterium]|nr:NAD(P)/FAD-dependent oxidoreductase [Planctomycetota bacterium]